MLPTLLLVFESGVQGESNVGTIWIGRGAFVDGEPALKHGQIRPEKGQSEIAVTAIRHGFKGCMLHLEATSDDVGEIYMYGFSRERGYVKTMFFHFWINGDLHFDWTGKPLCEFNEDSFYVFYGESLSGGTEVMSVAFDMIQVRTEADGRMLRALDWDISENRTLPYLEPGRQPPEAFPVLPTFPLR
jgi:hypothetical protein